MGEAGWWRDLGVVEGEREVQEGWSGLSSCVDHSCDPVDGLKLIQRIKIENYHNDTPKEFEKYVNFEPGVHGLDG